MTKPLFCLCFCVLIAFTGCKTASTKTEQQPTYVLVHGAWDGGWDWRHVDDLLTADGNKVFRATLTGQGERSHLANTNIDLDTHIQDVVNIILWENLHDVILVGHSYGGMVVTGVADRVPGRIKHLIYVDAMLPENGESANKAMGARKGINPPTNGFIIPSWETHQRPPPYDVPMPAKTFSEPITLTNQVAAGKIPTTYILTVDKGARPENDMFYRFYQRAMARGWPVEIMEADHNVHRSHPKELVQRLEKAVDGKN